MRPFGTAALVLMAMALAACASGAREDEPAPTMTVTIQPSPVPTVTVTAQPQESAIFPTWVALTRASVPEVSTWSDVQIYNAAVLWCSFVDQGLQQHPNDQQAAFAYAFNTYPNSARVAAQGTLHLCPQYDQPLREFLSSRGIATS